MGKMGLNSRRRRLCRQPETSLLGTLDSRCANWPIRASISMAKLAILWKVQSTYEEMPHNTPIYDECQTLQWGRTHLDNSNNTHTTMYVSFRFPLQWIGIKQDKPTSIVKEKDLKGNSHRMEESLESPVWACGFMAKTEFGIHYRLPIADSHFHLYGTVLSKFSFEHSKRPPKV